jgi:subtilase family serine protease
MAPGAKIEVVEAASNNYTDLFAASSYAASNGASVVSMSFSGDEDPGQDYNFNTSQSLAVANYNAAHPGAGQSGVLFVASTGDGGSAAGVGYPASNPYVVSVGGTALYVNANGSYSSETAWAGSGGGPSLYQLRPAYQNSVQTGKYRTEPDVAFDAANSTGVNLVFGGLTLSNKGGTSLGAPCWAALFALADQERVANGFPVLTSLDALNAMYATYNSPIYSQAFNDVVGGTNGAYYATVGYDEVTGLGSPIADYLVPYLAAYDTPEPASGAMIVLGWSLMLGRRKRR